jgi:hypothetical protein
MTIAELNDAFRTTGIGGLTYATSGINALSGDAQIEIYRRVRSFDSFTPDNDPRGEHDFGSFEHDGRTIFWKIDYYDCDLKSGSPDPADPEETTRVLTILLAEEY